MNSIHSFQFIFIIGSIWLIFTDVLANDPLYLSVTPKDAPCPPSLLSLKEIESLNIRLFNAIENQDYNEAQEALQAGAQANATRVAAEKPSTPSTLKTVLHVAVSIGDPSIIKLLLDFGAIIDLKFNAKDITPFAYLAYQQHIDSLNKRSIAALFIARNPEQKYIDEAFHHAIMAKNIIVAEAILEYAQISEEIESKLNYHPTLINTFFDVAVAITPSGQKAMKEKHHYAWMSRQLAQRRAHYPTKEDEQNTLTD